MLLDELDEISDVLVDLLFLTRRDGMPWHGNVHLHTSCLNARVDLLELVGCTLCLWLASVEAVLEVEERLPDGIREGDRGRIDEGDVTNSPAL